MPSIPAVLRTLAVPLILALGAPALLLLGAPAACAATVGSGQVTTETRAVGDFEAISLAGSIDLVVRQGTQESVQVRADDNLLPLVETVVEPASGVRTLFVRVKRGHDARPSAPIAVTVGAVRLTRLASAGSGKVVVEALKTPRLRLALSGSSDATLRGLDADAFDVGVAGSGSVQASGSARQAKLAIAGSGDIEAAQLAADDVTVRIAGSGDAKVTADKTLEVSIAGSGNVEYGGTAAKVRSTVAGSGRVSRR